MSTWTNLVRRITSFVRRSPDAISRTSSAFTSRWKPARFSAAGLAPDRARDEARRRLGGVDRYTEELRDVRGGRRLDAFGQDARYAARLALRFPSFTAIVVAHARARDRLEHRDLQCRRTPCCCSRCRFRSRTISFGCTHRIPIESAPRFSVSYADFLDWRQAHPQLCRHVRVRRHCARRCSATSSRDASPASPSRATSSMYSARAPRLGRLFGPMTPTANRRCDHPHRRLLAPPLRRATRTSSESASR